MERHFHYWIINHIRHHAVVFFWYLYVQYISTISGWYMPRGVHLTGEQKGQISAYHAVELFGRQIAARMGISKNAIQNYLHDPLTGTYGNNAGRKRKLSDADRRLVLRSASNAKKSCLRLLAETGVNFSKRTILREIQACPHLKYEKCKKRPPTTQRNMAVRVAWAQAHLVWGQPGQPSWENVIFGDAKKFNLDGPDGWDFYWHDMRKDPLFRMSRHSGGGGTMVYIFITATKKIGMTILDGKIDAERYIAVLEDMLLPNRDILCVGDNRPIMYLHDNARIHTARASQAWFGEHNFPLIFIPPYSPDLNPTENAISQLAREVYKDGRQYQSLTQLKNGLRAAWRKLDQTSIRNDVMSMPSRCAALIAGQGSPLDY